ncbi:MAG: hypothetical protein KBD78_15925 [Oligoflexales bacterium]|nr:hypothetical protein [Oligoflexales bacterium]
MSSEQKKSRYKNEDETITVEVAIKNSRQLYNERDPAPFRERDLDPQFVDYLVSAVEEFPLRTKMKIRLLSADHEDLNLENSFAIKDAIKAYFCYESVLVKAKLAKRNRTARFFFLIGLVTLISCLTLAQLIDSVNVATGITNLASVSLTIIGWVAMWHPLEALLYGWWPIREQRQYFEKIALIDVEVVSSSGLISKDD